MNRKIGRNDPCPCGSGRKYKHCHLGSDASAAQPSGVAPHAAAEQRVIEWLLQRHSNAMRAAFEGALFGELWPEDAPDPEDIEPALWDLIFGNVNEWILAEGDIEVGGRWYSVSEYVLGDRGPALSAPQRDYLAQFETSPLRLYTVTEVRPGEGLALVDALEAESAPLFVRERAGSEAARAGLLMGCRLMRVDDHLELSGELYPFSMLGASAALQAAREASELDVHPEDRAYEVARAIASEWIRQLVMPPALPQLVDASTGDSLVFVTDHYRIVDDERLVERLNACDALRREDDNGWVREDDGDDGITRPRAHLRRGKKADRLEVSYRTQRLADEGRPWFEAIAGDGVRHLRRKIEDFADAMRRAPDAGATSDAGARPRAADAGPHELPPELLSQAVEQALLRSYANWADEPIPALHDKTPREAMQTAAGLERVKGLLRSYEENEAQAAASQGRRPISYGFLWDSLGIEREETNRGLQ